ncbi:Protein spaetzle 3 [Amphibalanus amphitrite]|nr:Protein spaetzle 3 [Amphibalanus amphitrite]
MADRGRSFTVADLPCVQRLNQLYCKHQGPLYPAERIDQFIDLNKALTLRMFGEEPPAEVTTGPRPSDVTMAPPPSDVTTRNVSMAGTMMPNTMAGMRRFHTVQRVHYSTRTVSPLLYPDGESTSPHRTAGPLLHTVQRVHYSTRYSGSTTPHGTAGPLLHTVQRVHYSTRYSGSTTPHRR